MFDALLQPVLLSKGNLEKKMSNIDADAPRALFMGLATIDIIYRVDAPPEPNSKKVALSQEISAGGPATNAAVAYSLLGGRASLVSAGGRHPITALMATEFSHYGLRFHDLCPNFEGLPALSSIFVTDETGERIVVSANARVLAGYPKRVPEIDLGDFGIVLADGHHLQAAHFAGTCLVLDGGSWKPQLEDLLPLFNVVIASSNFRPPGCSNHAEVLQYLARKGVMRRAITRGECPVLAEHDSQHLEVPVPAVAAVDTLGAGDIFHGAFCAAYLPRADNFVEALVAATEVASLSTTVRGTRSWARPR
jgi:sugar/nucleoside kinase (ribokinase family)